MKKEKSFSERLAKLIGDEEIKPFARRSGVEEKSIRLYLAGKAQPTLASLVKLAKAAGRPIGWLADGEGEEATGQQMSYEHHPNREANPKFDDYIGKTARVITSKTIYRSALERNIDAFHKAVEMEDEMQGVKEKLDVMEQRHNADMDELKSMHARDMAELKNLILGQANEQKRDPAANA